jgi:hypothetical protein
MVHKLIYMNVFIYNKYTHVSNEERENERVSELASEKKAIIVCKLFYCTRCESRYLFILHIENIYSRLSSSYRKCMYVHQPQKMSFYIKSHIRLYTHTHAMCACK